ncbi:MULTISPECIES: ADP-ribosylglycohydrolase family protein [unclassified Microcoleus]|uniref:ADP-ribosylglycohydrolase family protein n=1 Tax=unclassified Microcoleus TaxID=2642155 RepID=UPI002FD37A9A
MLIELAIGDAYGAGFEFVDRQTIELCNNLNGYIKHPRHDIQPGCYTIGNKLEGSRFCQYLLG